MLLTRLFSLFTSKLSSDPNPITIEQIKNELHLYFAEHKNMPALTTNNDPHRREAKSTHEINALLYNIMQEGNLGIPASINDILGYPDPFENFNEHSWALLHVLFDQHPSIQSSTYSRIFNGLCHNPHATQAPQARLFLMSQSLFDLNAAGDDIMIEPIISSQDNWALLALLSQSTFNPASIQHHSFLVSQLLDLIKTKENNPYGENLPDSIKSDLWAFVRYSGIEVNQKETLMKNIAVLLPPEQITQCPANDLVAFIKISSSFPYVTDDVKGFLVDISFFLMLSEDPTRLSLQQQKFIEKKRDALTLQGKENKEEILTTITADQHRNRAYTMYQRFITIISCPGILDALVEHGKSGELKDATNKLFRTNSVSRIGMELFAALWPKGRFSCSAEAKDWLLGLDFFSDLVFVSSADNLKTILSFEDISTFQHIIEKHVLTNLSKKESLDLLQQATRMTDYTNINTTTAIQWLICHKIFIIHQYHHEASDAFKRLACVQTAHALWQVFSSGNVDIQDMEVDPWVLSNELSIRYKKTLEMILTTLINLSKPHEDLGYQKICAIHGLIKASPEAISLPDPIRFELTYRMALASNTAFTGAKGMLGGGKKADKFYFIQFVLKVLPFVDQNIDIMKLAYVYVNKNEERLAVNNALSLLHQDNTREMGLVQLAQFISKRTTPLTAEKVSEWITTTIFAADSGTSKTAESFGDLPSGLIERLFRDTSITHAFIRTQGGNNTKDRSNSTRPGLGQNNSTMYSSSVRVSSGQLSTNGCELKTSR